MTHPAHSSSRLGAEQPVNVRVRGEFIFAPTGIETRIATIGEKVRVERWQAFDLEARDLAEIL